MAEKSPEARTRKNALTMDEIARLAGVSKPTVSRVMNASPLVTAETREKVLKVARAHGYSVNRSAQRLRHNRANTIAVVMDLPSLPEHRVSQPFHFELLADVFNALNSAGQDVLLRSPDDEDVDLYQSLVSSKGVDGIIFLGQGTRTPILAHLAKRHVPFVAWGAPSDDYCTVGSDNRRGGFLAGRRLASLGRQRIAFVGRLEHLEMRKRRLGLEEGLRSEDVDPVIVDLEPADLSYKAAQEALRLHLLSGPHSPDGIFCASDTIAMAVIAMLEEHGLKVPRDVSVIGYDDIPQAAEHRPSVTSVRQDTRLAGALLVEKLLQLIENGHPASMALPTELVIRES